MIWGRHNIRLSMLYKTMPQENISYYKFIGIFNDKIKRIMQILFHFILFSMEFCEGILYFFSGFFFYFRFAHCAEVFDNNYHA